MESVLDSYPSPRVCIHLCYFSTCEQISIIVCLNGQTFSTQYLFLQFYYIRKGTALDIFCRNSTFATDVQNEYTNTTKELALNNH